MTRLSIFLIFWAIILWISGAVLNIEAFYVLSAILLAVQIVSLFFFLAAARGLKVERILPESARLGDTVTIAINIKSHRILPQTHILVRDLNPASIAGSPRLWISGLRAGQDETVKYELTLDRRGSHKLEYIEVKASDPLGFFRRKRLFKCKSRIVVFPRWEHIKTLSLKSIQKTHLASAENSSLEGDGNEFYGVREYRIGDGLKRIHWATTAKHGGLFVRQFESQTHPNICLFVDNCSRLLCSLGQDNSALDRNTAIAASIGLYTLSNGLRITCGYDKLEQVKLSHGISQKRILLDFLSNIKPECEKKVQKRLVDFGQTMSPGETLIAVVSELDVNTVAALSSFAYTGRPLVVILSSPKLKPAEKKKFLRKKKDPLIDNSAMYIQGLLNLGVPVVRDNGDKRLETILNAWLQ